MNKKKFIALTDSRYLNGIAHRGLHGEGITENGLKAFQKAIDLDLAFEFDIHLTKDGELIVCHDPDLKRTTGKDGKIESLTLEEIRDNYHLLDGGAIPTLQEVIDLNHEQVPIVIELKVVEDNYKEIAKAFIPYLSQFKDKSKMQIISFDPRCLWPLKHKGFLRSLLVAKSDFYTWIFRHTVEGVDVEDSLVENKKIMRYRKRHFVNVWTIQKEDQFERVAPYVDTVTYQYLNPEKVKNK